MKKNNPVLIETILGDYVRLKYPYFAGYGLKIKSQRIKAIGDEMVIGYTRTVWTSILKKYVIHLKGGGKKIIDLKAIYPNLEVLHRDKNPILQTDLKTLSPDQVKWHEHDLSGTFESVRGVEHIRDDSVELELRDLKEKHSDLLEENRDLQKRIEYLERNQK